MICWDFMLACGTTLPFCALIVIAGGIVGPIHSRHAPVNSHITQQHSASQRCERPMVSCRVAMHSNPAAPCDPQIGRIDQIP